MSVLHIIVISSVAAKTTGPAAKLHRDDAKDIKVATALATEQKINLQIHLIDPQFAQIAKTLTDLKLSLGLNVEIFPGRYDEWITFHQTTDPPSLPTKADDVIYLAPAANSFEVMDMAEPNFSENRWYLPIPSECLDFTGIVTAWMQRNELQQVAEPGFGLQAGLQAQKGSDLYYALRLPDLYGGTSLTGKYDQHNLEAMYKYALLTCHVLQYYLAAGYNYPEAALNPITELPSWMFNVEAPPIKGFIVYYGLYPQVADRDPGIDIRESGDYRRTLTSTMATGLANFAVNNGLVATDQITKGWLNRDTWDLIMEVLTKWDPTSFSASGNFTRYTGKLTPPPRPAEVKSGPLAPMKVEPVVEQPKGRKRVAVAKPKSKPKSAKKVVGAGLAPLPKEGLALPEEPLPLPGGIEQPALP